MSRLSKRHAILNRSKTFKTFPKVICRSSRSALWSKNGCSAYAGRSEVRRRGFSEEAEFI